MGGGFERSSGNASKSSYNTKQQGIYFEGENNTLVWKHAIFFHGAVLEQGHERPDGARLEDGELPLLVAGG